jgi:hypothetical protein
MSKSSQQRAVTNYRNRLSEKGLVRFEVTGRNADRELVRTLARRLAESSPEAERLRAAVKQTLGGEPPAKGGVLRALLASPLAGSGINLTRAHDDGRKVEL